MSFHRVPDFSRSALCATLCAFSALFWSPQRQDNFTTASPQGKVNALTAGYTRVERIEGWYYQPVETFWWRTAPKAFWHEGRGDHLTAVTQATTFKAAAAGYTLLHLSSDGLYVPEMAAPAAAGTVQLKLYWHRRRKDYFTTATAQGRADARAAGYRLIGTEGWVWQTANAVPLPSADHIAMPLSLYCNASRADNMLVPGGTDLEQMARQQGYAFVRHEGYVRAYNGIG